MGQSNRHAGYNPALERATGSRPGQIGCYDRFFRLRAAGRLVRCGVLRGNGRNVRVVGAYAGMRLAFDPRLLANPGEYIPSLRVQSRKTGLNYPARSVYLANVLYGRARGESWLWRAF